MLYRCGSSQVVVTHKKLSPRSVAFCGNSRVCSEEYESLAGIPGISDSRCQGHCSFLLAIHARHLKFVPGLRTCLLTTLTTVSSAGPSHARHRALSQAQSQRPQVSARRSVLHQTSPQLQTVHMTSTKYTWPRSTWHVMPIPGVPRVFLRRRLDALH